MAVAMGPQEDHNGCMSPAVGPDEDIPLSPGMILCYIHFDNLIDQTSAFWTVGILFAFV